MPGDQPKTDQIMGWQGCGTMRTLANAVVVSYLVKLAHLTYDLSIYPSGMTSYDIKISM